MPEGDTLYRTARTLQLGLAGQRVTRFRSAYPRLNRVNEDSPLAGRTIERVESKGKWLLIHFSGDLILLTHMLMSGSWHIYRPSEKWQRPTGQMRIAIETEKLHAVGFLVPVAEFHSSGSLLRRDGFRTLGPRLLDVDLDEPEAARRLLSGPDLEVGVALMTQSLLSGIGNAYKSEVCFACKVNPFRLVASLTESEAACLISTARRFMRANVSETSGDRIITYSGMRRTTGRSDPAARLWVYRRRLEPCRKCETPIESRKQGTDARTSFWCPQCQPMIGVRTSARELQLKI
jgi:endonuclease-8